MRSLPGKMINKLYHFDKKEQFERMDDLSYNKTINRAGIKKE